MRSIEGILNDYLAVEGKMVKSRWFQAGYMVEYAGGGVEK